MLYFIVSIILMTCAHIVRISRWKLFIEVYEKPKTKSLTQALSFGYLLNYVLPFKLGDFFRAWISGRKMKNGKALGFSTVIVERCLDVISVGFIFLILSFVKIDNKGILYNTAIFYAIVAAVLLAAIIVVYAFKRPVKKAVCGFAHIFNDRVESSILSFAWALIWNFKDIVYKINKIKMILSTLGMWLLYLSSYYLFAEFLSTNEIGATWIDVFTALFAQNGISSSTISAMSFWNETIVLSPFYIISYILIPLVLLFIVSFFQNKEKSKNDNDSHLNLLPHLDVSERLSFLENYFSDKNREYILNYLKINQNISIIRDYSAGSNATTMLCMDHERTFFRKYAFGEDGDKLYQQVLWIRDNSDKLVLPEILNSDKTDAYCFYDMPYNSHAIGLFEYVHSMRIDKGYNMIRDVLESLENSIYKINVRPADRATIDSYVNSKVLKNLEKIKNAKRISGLQKYDTVFINGVEFRNLPFYEKYLNSDYLEKIFADDNYAVIHGDLTIENVICTRLEDGNDSFYIIDPNTGNVHDSPNLDYGKLLQSIHGGYEFLMSTSDVSINGNHIDFLFTRSTAYTQLHNKLKSYMKTTFGSNRTRSIYFHEIIHWLRLMPYKIEKDGKRALLFYAGMLMVMNDVIEMYGDKKED